MRRGGSGGGRRGGSGEEDGEGEQETWREAEAGRAIDGEDKRPGGKREDKMGEAAWRGGKEDRKGGQET